MGRNRRVYQTPAVLQSVSSRPPHAGIGCQVDVGLGGCIADHGEAADICNGRALAGDPLGLGQFMLQYCQRRLGLGVIHGAHFVAELAETPGLALSRKIGSDSLSHCQNSHSRTRCFSKADLPSNLPSDSARCSRIAADCT